MNAKKEKIIKMSKILGELFVIGAAISAIAVVALTLGAAIAPTLAIDSFSFRGLWGDLPFGGGINEIRVALISEALGGGVVTAVLLITSFIFKDMSRGNTPFTKKNAHRLRLVSLLLVSLSIVAQPLRLLVYIIFVTSADGASVAINFDNLIFAATFFCLALIFEYGADLQQQADETLQGGTKWRLF
jgi:hypothetical protein